MGSEVKLESNRIKVESDMANTRSEEGGDVKGAASSADGEGVVDVPVDKSPKVEADASKLDAADATNQDRTHTRETDGNQTANSDNSARDSAGGDEQEAMEVEITTDDSNPSEPVKEGDGEVENTDHTGQQQVVAEIVPGPTRDTSINKDIRPVVPDRPDPAIPVIRVESVEGDDAQNTVDNNENGAGDGMASDEEATLSGETLVDNGQTGDNESTAAKDDDESYTVISSGFSTPSITFSDDDREYDSSYDTAES